MVKLASQTHTLSDKKTLLADRSQLNELRFALSTTLQSTLELDTTLRLFFDHLNQLLRCDGLIYRYDDKGIELQIGTEARHGANYRISAQHDELGSLDFRRSQPFAETELATIEMLIGTLFYPLRNALKYREAVEGSLMDSLSGLPNRAALDLAVTRELKLAQRHSKPLSLMVVDIDHFKRINDTYGHLTGDAVIRDVAQCLRNTVRETDQVFRFGGEEFVILLSETELNCAKASAERVRQTIQTLSFAQNARELQCSVSVGLASLSMGDTFDALFERADKALYEAKRNGRNQIQYAVEDIKQEIKKIA